MITLQWKSKSSASKMIWSCSGQIQMKHTPTHFGILQKRFSSWYLTHIEICFCFNRKSISYLRRWINYSYLKNAITFLDYFFRTQAGYKAAERLIVALYCLRTVNIELLAHSFREDISACYPCFSRDLLSTTGVRARSLWSGRMLDMGFMSFM